MTHHAVSDVNTDTDLSTDRQRSLRTRLRRSLVLSIVAAGIALVGSVIGLSVDGFYAGLTPAFRPQALAQDVANVFLAAPAMVTCAVLALRGSGRALMVWLGIVAFTVYNYVIYTVSVPFGPLFPVWTAVLGLSIFCLIGGLTSIDSTALQPRFRNGRAARGSAWVVLVIAGLFLLIWLSEDVPAVLGGTVQQSAIDMGVPTNPVHLLDYAFFLPAAVVSGVGVLRGRASAYPAVVGFLVFLALTCVPILITPFVQSMAGDVAGWSLMGPIGAVALVVLGTMVRLLGTVGRES